MSTRLLYNTAIYEPAGGEQFEASFVLEGVRERARGNGYSWRVSCARPHAAEHAPDTGVP